MQQSLTIGAKELGELLKPGVKDPARWIQNHHRALSDNDGMPRKLPGGWVWSRMAIMAWIGTYGAPAAARKEAAENLIRQQQRDLMDAFSGRAA